MTAHHPANAYHGDWMLRMAEGNDARQLRMVNRLVGKMVAYHHAGHDHDSDLRTLFAGRVESAGRDADGVWVRIRTQVKDRVTPKKILGEVAWLLHGMEGKKWYAFAIAKEGTRWWACYDECIALGAPDRLAAIESNLRAIAQAQHDEAEFMNLEDPDTSDGSSGSDGAAE